MKPTSDDFEPRRDGWFEHKGIWDEVTVGTVLGNSKRSQRWEVIETAHGNEPIEYGRTLWFRIREMTTGEIAAIPPKVKVHKVTILTQDPADTTTPPRSIPSDTEAIELVIRELGAELLARRDHETGEIVCPDYIFDNGHVPRDPEKPHHSTARRGMIEHMRFAHAMSVNDDLDYDSAVSLHGQAHNPRWPDIGKGGFSHRHLPEDLSLMG